MVSMKGGESFTVTGLPHNSTYIVTETPADGFELGDQDNTEGTIQAGQTQNARFENAYNSTTQKDGGGGAVIEARKVLKGGAIQADQFQFRLLNGAGEEVEIASAKPDGTVAFTALHYTLEDDGIRQVYYIEEVPGDDPNVIYDDHQEMVAVTVSDNGNGTMTVLVEYSGETEEERGQPPVFTNKVKPGELTITKTLTRWHDAGPATFVFQVEGVDDIGNTVYSNVTTLDFDAAG
ncbi:MAG: hypothetical protein J5927_05265, partial [Oscillospiraceae bacterium]|nr:hypothetical protein [Oscillospiraceae bacterium]